MSDAAMENGSASTGRVFAYFAPLTLLVYLVMPHGYLLDFATSYMLKDQLHASATQVSLFRLLTAIPVYNEERHLETVLQEVRRYTPEILVVNDGSTDRTPELLARQEGLAAG